MRLVHRRMLNITGLLAPIVLWELNARLRPSPLTPTAAQIGDALWRSVENGDLWYNAQQSIPVALAGLAIGVVVGVLAGSLMATSRVAEAVVERFLAGTYPLPKLALYPVFVLVLGLGNLPTILLVALECMYPVAYNTFQGARSVSKDLAWLGRNAQAPGYRMFLDLRFPTALPSILTGIRISVPLMVVVVVVVEMIGRSRGLGFMIKDAGRNLDPAQALGIVLLLGVFGFLVDVVIRWGTDRLVFWEGRKDAPARAGA